MMGEEEDMSTNHPQGAENDADEQQLIGDTSSSWIAPSEEYESSLNLVNYPVVPTLDVDFDGEQFLRKYMSQDRRTSPSLPSNLDTTISDEKDGWDKISLLDWWYQPLKSKLAPPPPGQLQVAEDSKVWKDTLSAHSGSDLHSPPKGKTFRTSTKLSSQISKERLLHPLKAAARRHTSMKRYTGSETSETQLREYSKSANHVSEWLSKTRFETSMHPDDMSNASLEGAINTQLIDVTLPPTLCGLKPGLNFSSDPTDMTYSKILQRPVFQRRQNIFWIGLVGILLGIIALAWRLSNTTYNFAVYTAPYNSSESPAENSSFAHPPIISNITTEHDIQTTPEIPRIPAPVLISMLVERSDAHMRDLSSLILNLPPPLSMSMSAHVALSLSSHLRAIARADTSSGSLDWADLVPENRRKVTIPCNYGQVAATLVDLAGGLNDASDSVLELQVDGVHTARNIIRLLMGLLSTVPKEEFSNEETPRKVPHTPTLEGPFRLYTVLLNWWTNLFGDRNELTDSNNTPKLATRSSNQGDDPVLLNLFNKVLDEIDVGLGDLESRVFSVRTRSVAAQSLWLQAHGIAQRERVRAEEVEAEVKVQREKAATLLTVAQTETEHMQQQGPIFSALQQLGYMPLFNWDVKTGIQKKLLRATAVSEIIDVQMSRVARDIQLFQQISAMLEDMAPMIVELEHCLKRLREEIQVFRGHIGGHSGAIELFMKGHSTRSVEQIQHKLADLFQSFVVSTRKGMEK